MEATPEDMSICPGIGEQKVINFWIKSNFINIFIFVQVRKIQDTFEQPFSVLKKWNDDKGKEEKIVVNDE